MNKEIIVPSLGESISQGVLVQWLKHEGDMVSVGEDLFELETDKATLAVPSPHHGRLIILVTEGSEVTVGQIVGHIDSTVEIGARESREHVISPGPINVENGEGTGPLEQSTSPSSVTTPAGDTAHKKGLTNLAGVRHLSPAVRKLVSDHGLDAAAIQGSGKESRITKADVLTYIEEREQSEGDMKQHPKITTVAGLPLYDTSTRTDTPDSHTPPVETDTTRRQQHRVKRPTIRRRIAERLVRAQHESAFLTTFNDVSMARIIDIREQYNDAFQKKHGLKLGFMSFFVKASCAALREWPSVNAMIDGDDFVYHDYYDIGIAVSTERGLVVPVLRNADTMSFHRIERDIADFALRARTKRLTLDELSGGTFSISNGGVFGSLMSTPIPNPPQTAILGLHTIQKRPVVEADEIVIRPMMYLALSYDHRMIDGREAVSFLRQIKDAIENPERLLLEL